MFRVYVSGSCCARFYPSSEKTCDSRDSSPNTRISWSCCATNNTHLYNIHRLTRNRTRTEASSLLVWINRLRSWTSFVGHYQAAHRLSAVTVWGEDSFVSPDFCLNCPPFVYFFLTYAPPVIMNHDFKNITPTADGDGKVNCHQQIVLKSVSLRRVETLLKYEFEWMWSSKMLEIKSVQVSTGFLKVEGDIWIHWWVSYKSSLKLAKCEKWLHGNTARASGNQVRRDGKGFFLFLFADSNPQRCSRVKKST